MDAEGRFLSHAVSAGRVAGGQPRRRRRRDVGIGTDEWEEPKEDHVADQEKLYYNVTIFGREFHLRLRHNTRLVAPGAKMEWHDDSDSTRHTEPLHDECLYVGDITDTPGATVAISNCDGLVSARTKSCHFYRINSIHTRGFCLNSGIILRGYNNLLLHVEEEGVSLIISGSFVLHRLPLPLTTII